MSKPGPAPMKLSQVVAEQKNVFLEFLRLYGPAAGEEGPLLFVKEVLGIQPDPWQERALRDFGRGERRISIRSCHGSGKTALASWLILYSLLFRYPQKTVATAPSASQLKGALVPEVKHWLRNLPQALQDLFDVKAEGIYLRAAPESSFFEARTARQDAPEAIQGIHSEHVLLVVDEASGVPEAVFEAGVGSMSGHSATTILLGNPTRSSGFFFNTHHSARGLWRTYHITGVPGSAGDYSPRVSSDFVKQVRVSYGEDSNAYRVRALGEFPKTDQDTIIPFELLASAQERDIVVPPDSREVWGLDVARFGDDANALVRRTPLAVLPDIEKWQGLDLMQTAGRVHAKWNATEPSKRPREILIDVIGLGAGVVDRLTELGLPARGINVSEAASLSDRYRNLRTELWFRAKEWLGNRDRKLPKGEQIHEELIGEASVLKYKFTSSGKLMAEPKDELKKRGHASPNVAEAFILTFAADAATLMRGSDNGSWGATSWNEPAIRGRNILI